MSEFYSALVLARHVSDLIGPKHVELTQVLNKTHLLNHFVYIVGLHICCLEIHFPPRNKQRELCLNTQYFFRIQLS